MPPVLNDSSIQDILVALVVFMCSYQYIKNPYLTAKLVEVMFVLNPAVQRNTEKLNEMMLTHPLAFDHLVPALMKFYVGKGPIIIYDLGGRYL